MKESGPLVVDGLYRDEILQIELYGDYFVNHEIRIIFKYSQDSMESSKVSFSWLRQVAVTDPGLFHGHKRHNVENAS